MLPGHGGRLGAAGRTLEKALLNEIGFAHILASFAVFAHGGREIVYPDGTAREFFENRAQELRVDEVEPHGVDVEHREGGLRHFPRHASVVAHLRVVAHATKKAVRDARRAAASARDFRGAFVVDRHVEKFRRTLHDERQLFGRIKLQLVDDPEAGAKGIRERPRARRGADEREGRKIELDRKSVV